jgi:hypothetical protein
MQNNSPQTAVADSSSIQSEVLKEDRFHVNEVPPDSVLHGRRCGSV